MDVLQGPCEFLDAFSVKTFGLSGLWFKTILYGDEPTVAVKCELYTRGNKVMFVDDSAYFSFFLV